MIICQKFARFRNIEHDERYMSETSPKQSKSRRRRGLLPYFGRNNCKQRMKDEPVRVGNKMWVLAEESGYVVSFDPYKGAKTGCLRKSTPKTWGSGERVVLKLIKKLAKGPSYHIFMDNFFLFLVDKSMLELRRIDRKRFSKSVLSCESE